MDVGASAVKCIVLDTGGKILWRQYIHHDCRVVETVERVMTWWLRMKGTKYFFA